MISLSEKNLETVSRRPWIFIMLIFIAGNVYQYIDRRNIVTDKDEAISQLNEKLKERDQEALRYERERNTRYEYLLNSLPKITSQNENTQKNMGR